MLTWIFSPRSLDQVQLAIAKQAGQTSFPWQWNFTQYWLSPRLQHQSFFFVDLRKGQFQPPKDQSNMSNMDRVDTMDKMDENH
jgi:hypothetical protein